MAKTEKLTEQDRRFFQLVSAAAFSNPFGDERAELDRQLAGLTGAPKDKLLQAVIDSVEERVRALERAGRAHLARYAGDEREAWRWACSSSSSTATSTPSTS